MKKARAVGAANPKTSKIRRVGIIGAGAWGTALALSLRRAGQEVLLWAHDEAVAHAINGQHLNPDYLPGVALDPAINATCDVSLAAKSDVLLVVTPAKYLREVVQSFSASVAPHTPVIVCTKGIEQETGRFMSEIVQEALPAAEVGVLSGPSFASEVAQGLPAALTLACENEVHGRAVMLALANKTFRVYGTSDVIGTQVGGAVKNVLAIAAGIVRGRKLGANAHAALVTRGFAELVRFGTALGAKFETLTGLSGLGDLILTCSSEKSRNMSLGVALGEGRALDEILASRKSVAEGVYSVSSVMELASRHRVDMPICEAVNDVISGKKSIDAAADMLLSRPFRAEADTQAKKSSPRGRAVSRAEKLR